MTRIDFKTHPRGASSVQRPARPGLRLLAGVTQTPEYPLDPSWDQPQPSFELELVDAVNAHRATLGLSQLTVSPALKASAEWKASQSSTVGYLNHDDDPPPVARTWEARFDDNGWPATYAAGENIAYGYTSAATVMSAFLSDAGHKANIENPAWTSIGCGWATHPPQTAGDGSPVPALSWAVQDFGAIPVPIPQPSPAPDPTPTPKPAPAPAPAPAPPAAGEVWANKATGAEVEVTVVTKNAAGVVTKVTYVPVTAKKKKTGVAVTKAVKAFDTNFARVS